MLGPRCESPCNLHLSFEAFRDPHIAFGIDHDRGGAFGGLDQREAFLWTQNEHRVIELIREQLLRKTEQEVPYSCAVLIEEFDEAERETGKRGLVRITATILVERDSQKGIVIGKKGAMLKAVGSDARREMEKLLGCKVFLQLHVRVEPEWTRSDKGMTRAGYTK